MKRDLNVRFIHASTLLVGTGIGYVGLNNWMYLMVIGSQDVIPLPPPPSCLKLCVTLIIQPVWNRLLDWFPSVLIPNQISSAAFPCLLGAVQRLFLPPLSAEIWHGWCGRSDRAFSIKIIACHSPSDSWDRWSAEGISFKRKERAGRHNRCTCYGRNAPLHFVTISRSLFE